ncbi:MAG TPA: bifunctional phosphoribosylaminoimidazolecarboxamide formyltransferase/IMP cyclohydrolase [Anaerolineae bacterium]|nr:bifunctional phosphoribosylaminoimidazolecarboxamide formyltransferase/IMP cyclohydrolase [Anaerolineae bacterium]
MRVLISVSDKTGIEGLGSGLADLGAEIYSTGGTKRALEAAGVPVRPVSDLTGFPEVLDGRVKTLHPGVHAGILARRDVPAHLEELKRHGLGPIDLVAVNLYPFERTVAEPDVKLASALEQIDIGGPTLLRAAAKNYPAVLPLCDPADYAAVLEVLAGPSGPDEAFRRRLAAKAFRHVAVYDALIASYLAASDADWPNELPLGLRQVQEMRYGENPQQRAAFYAMVQPQQKATGVAAARQVQGKPLSYNNILDADAAWSVARDFQLVTVAIIKHTNPCGLAQADEQLAAYDLALAGDPLAAFGGIVAVNALVEAPLAQRLVERFYEIVLAPVFADEALEVLATRPNLRVLELPSDGIKPQLTWRSVVGGVLVQEADRVGEVEVDQGRVVTRRAPTGGEWAALRFAWRAVRHVKSNAIVLAQGPADEASNQLALVGMGAGQPSRVAAVEIAIARAGSRVEGAVLASDAFFPKADGVETAARAGVRAIVQPGGSLGDEEVIAAADAAGLAMVFTGKRHFLH